MAIFLVILCGLLSHKKLKSVWSICFKSWHDGVGRTDNLYISWDSRSDLITVIFPKSVSFREDHILIIFWIFSKAGYILWHRTSDRSVVSEIPRIFTTSWVHTQPFIQTQIKENTKAPRHWALCGEFTGDRWIPRTNDQWRGKCFHLITSSWFIVSSSSNKTI